MATSMIHLFVTVLLVAAHTAFAETNMLQDLCVADLKASTAKLSDEFDPKKKNYQMSLERNHVSDKDK
ncbi:hypothetical protein F2Q70_00009661 [Brassica cretica]|uniref:Pectinesterase inhibitor domain-containing protein n=1 Tax=Brassica cretica TaxID=69181 RepID=A0A8S9MB22_BRACR|nr:hypothetical protein F2Q70_00009661 [Brassica cretica]